MTTSPIGKISMKVSEKGLTFIELTVVLALLGTLLATLAPRFSGAFSQARSAEAARRVRDFLTEAQSQVFEKGKKVSLTCQALQERFSPGVELSCSHQTMTFFVDGRATPFLLKIQEQDQTVQVVEMGSQGGLPIIRGHHGK